MPVILLDCREPVCYLENLLFRCQLAVFCYIILRAVHHGSHSEGQGTFGFLFRHAADDRLRDDKAADFLDVLVGELYLRNIRGGTGYAGYYRRFAFDHGGLILQLVSLDRRIRLGHGVLAGRQGIKGLRVVDLDVFVRYLYASSLVICIVPGPVFCIVSKLMAVILLDCREPVCYLENLLFRCQLAVFCYIILRAVHHGSHSEGQGTFGFLFRHAADDRLRDDKAADFLDVLVGELYLRNIRGGTGYAGYYRRFAFDHGGLILQLVSLDCRIRLGHGVLAGRQIVKGLCIVDLDVLVRHFYLLAVLILVEPGAVFCIVS